MSLNHIVIANDFSKHAEYALQRAISLAKQHSASLYQIHVLKQPWPGNFAQFSIAQQDRLLEIKKQTQEKLLNLLNNYAQDLTANVSVLSGRIADEITRYAQENHSDLIVAGAHGEYHINDYVLGTTAGDIIRQGNIPVLLIKKEPSVAYNRILIATDFSHASKKAVEFSFQCFPEATFQLLHIVDIYYRQFLKTDEDNLFESVVKHEKTKDILEKLDDFLKSCDVAHEQFDKKIIGGYLADSIVMQSNNWNANLLVFGTQGRSQLHYLLMGSVAKRLLQLSDIDMLAVPPTQDGE